MKSVRIAYTLLCFSLLAVITNSIVLNTLITQTLNSVNSISESNPQLAYEEYESIHEDFKSKEVYISLTVNHEDLTDVESSFAEIIGAAKANDEKAITTIKSRLIDSLEHLRRLSGISLDSIL